ncbi:MAG: PHB depolymerase family esterase [Pseudomonadota bacterium]|nr:PHB depolymerase family esterase [Pseudomonadota bacterium]
MSRFLRQRPVSAPAGSPRTPLKKTVAFGSNPGGLAMLSHVPSGPGGSSLPLVVVLHGCTQTAAAYDHGSGWSALAERCGFAVLFPEQAPANNPKRCFNWFQPADTARNAGEALSILQMIERLALDHHIDRRRIFVTGLSAGGAMAAAMLAAYPEIFAGGAVIAGLPYGTAGTVKEAFEAMFTGHRQSPQQWGDLIRSASSHRGPWPTVAIWHGMADKTVVPVNADELVKQWQNVHQIDGVPATVETVGRLRRQVWHAPDGKPVIEKYSIAGMGHGAPLDVRDDAGRGHAGPFMLDVGISSTYQCAFSWGITGPIVRRHESPENEPVSNAPFRPRQQHGEVGVVIANALRSAGLMK